MISPQVNDGAYDFAAGALNFRTIEPLSDGERLIFQVEFQNPLRLQPGARLNISGIAKHQVWPLIILK